MKIHVYISLFIFLAVSACSPTNSDVPPSPAKQPALPAQPVDSSLIKGGVVVGDRITGKVTKTMDASGYTYVSVDVGLDNAVWAVGPQTSIKVGDAVDVAKGSQMKRFRSKTLNKVFEPIYFISSFGSTDAKTSRASSGPASMPTARPASQPSSQPVKALNSKPPKSAPDIPKAKGGYTVSEIYEKSSELTSKSILIRARVVKFNAGIMGKNWLHLRDGTGDVANKTNDLTVTSDSTAAVGQVVLMRGVLATDKDFGAGYKYPVILEQSTLVQE